MTISKAGLDVSQMREGIRISQALQLLGVPGQFR